MTGLNDASTLANSVYETPQNTTANPGVRRNRPPQRRHLTAARTAVALAALAALVATSACATSSKTNIRMLQTTDIHGFYSNPVGKPGKVAHGGLRGLAALVDAERAKPEHDVVLLDSGDMWSGTILSDRTEGSAGVRLFNALKYDAAALGNHEFDYGPAGEPRFGEGKLAFGALVKRIEEASFPILACNLRDKETGKKPGWMNFKKSIVIHRGGWKIGVVGAITEDTPSITFPYVGKTLIFDDPAPAITAEAKRLRVIDKVDLVVVVAHIGGKCRTFKDPKDLGSCHSDSHAFKIAREVPKGMIQAIFGGHTHRRVAHWVNGVAVMQAGRHGRAVAVLDLEPGEEGRPILHIRKHQPVMPVVGSADGAKLSKTAAYVDSILSPMEKQVAAIRGEALGARVVNAMGRNRQKSSTMGSFVCDVLKAIHPDRDLCLVNSGGIRKGFPAGPLTYGHLYDTLPFGNALAYADVSGATLLELVRLGTSGAHGVIQVAGMTVTYDRSKDPCPTKDISGDGKVDAHDRNRVVDVKVGGATIDPARTYKIVTSSFLALGGDGFGVALNKAKVTVMHDQPPIREQVGAWLRKARPILNADDNKVQDKPRVNFVGAIPTIRCKTSAGGGGHGH